MLFSKTICKIINFENNKTYMGIFFYTPLYVDQIFCLQMPRFASPSWNFIDLEIGTFYIFTQKQKQWNFQLVDLVS